VTDLSFFIGNEQVASQCQLKAPGDCETIDAADDDLRSRLHPREGIAHEILVPHVRRTVMEHTFRQPLEVISGTKRAARTAYDHDLHRIARRYAVAHGIVQCSQGCAIERVHAFRSRKGEPPHEWRRIIYYQCCHCFTSS